MGSHIIKALTILAKLLEWDAERQRAKAEKAEEAYQAALRRTDDERLAAYTKRVEEERALHQRHQREKVKLSQLHSERLSACRNKKRECQHQLTGDLRVLEALKPLTEEK